MSKKKTTDVITIAPTLELTPFTETLQRSGLELSKAERYAAGYAPLMSKVLEQVDIIKGLDKLNPEHGPKAKRASLDLGKICSRLTDKKADDKAVLLLETRCIDGLFNVATSTARLAQKDADNIANYAATVEVERLAALVVERKELLLPYGTDVTYIQLDRLTTEQFANLLANEELLFNAKKAEAERVELQRLENERKAEELFLEAERLQAERIEAERLENERVRKELADKEALLNKERNERAEQERFIEENRLQNSKIAAASLVGLGFKQMPYGVEFGFWNWYIDPKSYSKFDTQEEIDLFILAVKKSLDKQRADHDVKLKAEKEQEEERKKQAEILEEQQRKANKEREAQRAILLKQQEATRKAQEALKVKQDAEAKIIADKKAAELAALAAPDKIKIRVLYDAIKGIAIPELQSEPGKAIAILVAKRLKELLVEVAAESKKLL